VCEKLIYRLREFRNDLPKFATVIKPRADSINIRQYRVFLAP